MSSTKLLLKLLEIRLQTQQNKSPHLEIKFGMPKKEKKTLRKRLERKLIRLKIKLMS